MFQKRAFLLFMIVTVGAGLVIGCSCEEPPKPKPAPTKPQAQKPAPVPAPEPAAEAEPFPSPQEQLEHRVEIPDHYPDDALIYPGAHASAVVTKDGRLSVIFSTQDTNEAVVAYTTDFLGSAGWENTSVNTIPNGTIISADKRSSRSIVVLVSEIADDGSDGVTMIAVAVDP